MKTTAKKNVASWLAAGLMMVSPCIGVVAASLPTQNGVTTISPKLSADVASGGRTDGVTLAKRPILARNTSAKAETATATPKEPQKAHAKSTINRCWKRLMNNLREVRQAHRNRAN